MTNEQFYIDWPSAVTIGTFLFTFSGFYWTTRSDMKTIKDELSMLRKAVEQIAIQNVRLDNHGQMIAAAQKQQSILEERLYKLSQGIGFQKERMDGEYP